MQLLPAQQFRIYLDFKSIESSDLQGIIRFYDQYADQIRLFDFDDYFDCTLIYTNALYETGKHLRSVAMCTELLEVIIGENIKEWEGVDVYQSILLQKGASLWYLKNYKEASYNLEQFAKMYPTNETGKTLFKASLFKQIPPSMVYIRWITAILSVGTTLFFISDIICSLVWDYPLLTARQYYPLVLGLSVSVFCWSEIRHFVKCIRLVNRKIRTSIEKKISIQSENSEPR